MPAPRVVIAGPNAALDHLLSTYLHRNEVQVAARIGLSAGGKGINVARTLRLLGMTASVVTLLGGEVGALIGRIAADDGLLLTGVPVAADSRIATICLSANDGAETVLNEPGPHVTSSEWHLFCGQVERRFGESELLACIGSLPPGAPSEGYRRLLVAAHERGISTVVDTTGSALAAALDDRPDVIKVNAVEAAAVVGMAFDEGGEKPRGTELALALKQAGARIAIVTLGAEGTAVAGDDGEVFTTLSGAPGIYRHAVGAGDAFTAGFVHSYLAGSTLRAAVEDATATAVASTSTWTPGDLDPVSVQTLADIGPYLNTSIGEC